MPPIEIISLLIGTIIGLVLAVTGAGGASLSIPLLTTFLHLSIYEAAPIALITVFTASCIGSIHGLINGNVRYKAAILIACFGIALAPMGVKLAQLAPNQLLSFTLSTILFFISISTWKRAKKLAIQDMHLHTPACSINPATAKISWTAPCAKRLMLTGTITGFLSGFLGVGGGFVIVPSLNLVSNFNQKTIVATTLTAVSLVALSGITSHMQLNTVNWHIAIPFATGTTLSMLITTALIKDRINKQISQKCLQPYVY